MTVLLIDGVGRRREYEVENLYPEVLIAVPRPPLVAKIFDLYTPLEPTPMARFVLEDEPSWPPVYRYVETVVR